MKFEYSPGLIGYGTQGADGSVGSTGFALYFTDHDYPGDLASITYALENNYVLWSTQPDTLLSNGKVYQNGELFLDKQGNVYEIDLDQTINFVDTGMKLSSVDYFTTDPGALMSNGYQRVYNIFADIIDVSDMNEVDTRYIIDTMYSKEPINYLNGISSIYSIEPKNYERVEFSNIDFNTNIPFTVYSSGEIIGTDDHKGFAIIRDIDNNTFRIGNIDTSSNIRGTNIIFDVSSFKKNSTPISLNTTTYEVLSNIEFGSNALFTGVFDNDPSSFLATPTNTTTLAITWDLGGFTDTSIKGDLHFYEKTPAGISFTDMIFHDVSTLGTITITDLSTNGLYGYHMKILKNGWIRNSILKEIIANETPPSLSITSPSPASFDVSANEFDNTVTINSNVIWGTTIGYTAGGTGWIYCEPTTGVAGGSETFDVSVYQNTSQSQRTGYIDVTSSAITQRINITQDASVIVTSDVTAQFDSASNPTIVFNNLTDQTLNITIYMYTDASAYSEDTLMAIQASISARLRTALQKIVSTTEVISNGDGYQSDTSTGTITFYGITASSHDINFVKDFACDIIGVNQQSAHVYAQITNVSITSGSGSGLIGTNYRWGSNCAGNYVINPD